MPPAIDFPALDREVAEIRAVASAVPELATLAALDQQIAAAREAGRAVARELAPLDAHFDRVGWGHAEGPITDRLKHKELTARAAAAAELLADLEGRRASAAAAVGRAVSRVVETLMPGVFDALKRAFDAREPESADRLGHAVALLGEINRLKSVIIADVWASVTRRPA